MTVNRVRRAVTGVLSVALLLLAGAACKTGGAEADVNDVVVSTDYVPTSLNPGLNASGSDLDTNFLETAVDTTTNSAGNIVLTPVLASSWKQTGADTWRFTVRPKVTFSNGERLTAKAFKYSLELAQKKSNQTGPILADYKIRVVDPMTFDVTNTKTADARIPQQMIWLYVYPPKYTEKVGFNEFGTKPVGTGPYVVSDFKASTSVTMKANPSYWDGKPAVENVRLNLVPDAATRVNTLLSGAAQVAYAVPASEEKRVKNAPDLTLTSAPSATSDYLQLNVTKAPFDDPRVAEAASLAIDRRTLLDSILNGEGEPYNSLVYPNMLDGAGAKLQLSTKPDLARAKRLVAQAGSDAKTPFTIFTSADVPQGELLAEAIQAQLKAVGLKPDIRTFQSEGQYFDKWTSGKVSGMALYQNTLPWPSPDLLFQGFFSPGTLYASLGSWPQATTMAARARAEANSAKRIQRFRDLQELILEKHHAWIPLFIVNSTDATTSNLEFPAREVVYGTYAGLTPK